MDFSIPRLAAPYGTVFLKWLEDRYGEQNVRNSQEVNGPDFYVETADGLVGYDYLVRDELDEISGYIDTFSYIPRTSGIVRWTIINATDRENINRMREELNEFSLPENVSVLLGYFDEKGELQL